MCKYNSVVVVFSSFMYEFIKQDLWRDDITLHWVVLIDYRQNAALNFQLSIYWGINYAFSNFLKS